MEGHLDIFADLMFDVYQSFQNKNSHELMDYLSKTSDPFTGNNAALSSTNTDFNNNSNYNVLSYNGVDPTVPDGAILDEFSNEKLVPQDEELINYVGFMYNNNTMNMNFNMNNLTLNNNNVQQIYKSYNSDDSSSNSTLFNQFDSVSPQSSLNSSSLDINSIFTYDINPETLTGASSAATRTNSISSLSSIASNSVLIKTPGDHPNTIKLQQTKKSPFSSLSSSSSSTSIGAMKSLTMSDSGKNRAGKRHSDSRLSLNELSNFLSLDNDLTETARREQEILTIFKDELGFELGLKTWVRDTSSYKRLQLVADLTRIVESRFHYGYTEKTIEVIIRRASYYTMQGRLRRERRSEQKIKGDKFDKGNRRNKRS